MNASLLAFALLCAAPQAEHGDSPPVIELQALAAGQVPEVKLSPEWTTTLLFDAELVPEQVRVEGRERFRRVRAAGDSLLLQPSPDLRPGERLRLSVRFKEGTPTGADFLLVVQSGEGDRQVEVYRQPRGAESLREALKQSQQELRKLREELHKLRGERGTQAAGLVEWLAGGMMDRRGVVARDLKRELPATATEPLQVQRVTLYRALGRAAVELWVEHRGPGSSWKAESASVTGPVGEPLKVLAVWQPAVLAAGSVGRVVVEMEAVEVHGPYVLRLWEQGESRSVVLQGLTFP
jgi:uncharacterized protein (TIGR02268 family)